MMLAPKAKVSCACCGARAACGTSVGRPRCESCFLSEDVPMEKDLSQVRVDIATVRACLNIGQREQLRQDATDAFERLAEQLINPAGFALRENPAPRPCPLCDSTEHSAYSCDCGQ